LERDSKWMEEQKEKDREMEKGGKGKRGREKVILPSVYNIFTRLSEDIVVGLQCSYRRCR